MVPAARIAEFALLSWALIIVPGPNVLFAISRSLQQGRTAGLAAYLVFLGVRAIRHRQDLARALGQPGDGRPVRRVLADGFVVGATNPKAIVFFVAVLPQFADRAAGHVPLQMLLLGSVFVGIALISDSMYALVAGTVRGWLAGSPRRLAAVGGTGGLAMIGIGATLALTGRKD